MPKGQILYQTSGMISDLYKDIYDNLPEITVMRILNMINSFQDLQTISKVHPKMGELIEKHALRPLIQNVFGENALVIYDRLIEQGAQLSLSKYYLIRKKLLVEAVEELKKCIGSNNMKFVTSSPAWPAIIAAELNDLNNLSDKKINENYQTIIAYLASPELRDSYGCTFLHWTACMGHHEIVKALLAHPGIDVNKANNTGHTPLNWAAYNGHLEIVKALLAHKDIDVNKASDYGRTPLHTVSLNGRPEIVKALLAHLDIDVNKADIAGSTSLLLAQKRGHTEIVTLLNNHLAAANNNGTSALVAPGYAALSNNAATSNESVNRSNQNCCTII